MFHPQVLLGRHRKSMNGESYQGEISSDHLNYFRFYKYLDVLVFVCLQYIRSYYPHVPQGMITAKDVVGNCNVRLLTCDVLNAIFGMLEERLHTQKDLPRLVLELLNRCKVQKLLLHSLVASVYQQKAEKENSDAFTYQVIDYNDRKTVEFQVIIRLLIIISLIVNVVCLHGVLVNLLCSFGSNLSSR